MRSVPRTFFFYFQQKQQSQFLETPPPPPPPTPEEFWKLARPPSIMRLGRDISQRKPLAPIYVAPLFLGVHISCNVVVYIGYINGV